MFCAPQLNSVVFLIDREYSVRTQAFQFNLNVRAILKKRRYQCYSHHLRSDLLYFLFLPFCYVPPEAYFRNRCRRFFLFQTGICYSTIDPCYCYCTCELALMTLQQATFLALHAGSRLITCSHVRHIVAKRTSLWQRPSVTESVLCRYMTFSEKKPNVFGNCVILVRTYAQSITS